ncbi:hypothetical protein [Rhodopseudomonas palustris]|uniref:Uncharacterized protein n=1 Tax=Rhodopseudomonas palustris (strain BisB18) TaxID=316056 RepID=Q216B8_RHOPB
MTAISTSNTSANAAIASLIKDAASSGSPLASQRSSSSSPSASAAGAGNPVDIVDLSDHAKQILARAKTEQVAAGKLSDLVQSLQRPGGKTATAKPKSDDATSLFDKLSGRSQTQASSTTQWEAGSKYGDPTISDAGFIDKIKDALLTSLSGAPAEKVAALQTAIDSGTLQVQKASDVAGLNYQSTVSYTGSPGGLQGMSVTHQSNPTGAAKDSLDQGRALAFWTADRGDVYVSW